MIFDIEYTTTSMEAAFVIRDFITDKLRVRIIASGADTRQPKGSFTYEVTVKGEKNKNKVVKWLKKQKIFRVSKVEVNEVEEA
ncbi:hypothetical protein LCGC14_0840040 [marine sediment metagenome]|uniref:Uncharacterized protein n=1 Tax=marine sediment metagenome TaxID=412755 RepID=A0A0F9RY38_9ZZZZ